MIFARLYGGMGNQMFQYAFCRKLQQDYNQDICFDVSKGTEFAVTGGDEHKSTVLGDFSIDANKIHYIYNKREFNKCAGVKMIFADFLSLLPRGIRKLNKNNHSYKQLVRLIQKIFNKKGYYTAYDCFSKPIYNSNNKNVYVNGLFTSKEYFQDIYEILVKEFVPSHERNQINQKFISQITCTNSVCVHVRKGNSYVNNNYLNVCTSSYFEDAIEEMENIIENPVFFIFSNDFNWCYENIELQDHNYVFVNANDSKHAVDELDLMRNCKHFILSNSTMGWWAQFLCENPNKIVVSPHSWTNGKIELLSDLIEQKWIKVEGSK